MSESITGNESLLFTCECSAKCSVGGCISVPSFNLFLFGSYHCHQHTSCHFHGNTRQQEIDELIRIWTKMSYFSMIELKNEIEKLLPHQHKWVFCSDNFSWYLIEKKIFARRTLLLLKDIFAIVDWTKKRESTHNSVKVDPSDNGIFKCSLSWNGFLEIAVYWPHLNCTLCQRPTKFIQMFKVLWQLGFFLWCKLEISTFIQTIHSFSLDVLCVCVCWFMKCVKVYSMQFLQTKFLLAKMRLIIRIRWMVFSTCLKILFEYF